MNIEGIIWTRNVVEKLAVKHHVETFEVEQMLAATPKFRFVETGERENEDVYLALGQASSGRYLVAYFIYKKTKEALILSARDMADKVKEMVWQKIIHKHYRNSLRSMRWLIFLTITTWAIIWIRCPKLIST